MFIERDLNIKEFVVNIKKNEANLMNFNESMKMNRKLIKRNI